MFRLITLPMLRRILMIAALFRTLTRCGLTSCSS
jgi:ABC-type sugar transport system permease subunit